MNREGNGRATNCEWRPLSTYLSNWIFQTLSGRVARTPKWYEDFITFEALSLNSQNKFQDPVILFKATADPATMYYQEVMREPDADQFKKAMQEKIDAHNNNKNWKIIEKMNCQPELAYYKQRGQWRETELKK